MNRGWSSQYKESLFLYLVQYENLISKLYSPVYSLVVLHISGIQMTLCVIKAGFQMCSFSFSYVEVLLTKLTWVMERGYFTCSQNSQAKESAQR